MSQNTSFTDENFTYMLSPLNFTKIDEIKKVPSSPDLISKFSKNCPNSKKIYDCCERKDKISKNTNSITTNITSTNTNSNNISADDKERNKIYNNLTNILSQFLMDEELLLNSNFVPRSFIKNNQMQNNTNNNNNNNNNNKNCKNNNNNITGNTGDIYKYLFFAKNEKTSFLPYIIDQNKNNLTYEKCYYYKKLSENIVSQSCISEIDNK